MLSMFMWGEARRDQRQAGASHRDRGGRPAPAIKAAELGTSNADDCVRDLRGRMFQNAATSIAGWGEGGCSPLKATGREGALLHTRLCSTCSPPK